MTKVPLACVTAQNLTSHLIFQTSNIYQLIISFSSIIPLGYFIIFKLLKSSFHGNLKVVLVAYFVSFLLFSCVFVVLAMIQIIIPIISKQPCDLFIPLNLFKLGIISISFLITLSIIFPFSITIERTVAMMTADEYETFPVLIGPSLVVFNILLNSLIIFAFFKNEQFSGDSVSFIFLPPAAAQKMFTLYIILFVSNLINVLVDLLLIYQNLRLKKHANSSSLATKYLLEEVFISTKFSVFVIFTHVSLFGCYVLSAATLRYFGSIWIKNSITLSSLRVASTTIIPTYNFIIGIVAIYIYNKSKTMRVGITINTIQISSIGKSGAINYDQAINNIWNSFSNTEIKKTSTN